MTWKRGRPKKRPIVVDTRMGVFFCQMGGEEIHIHKRDWHWIRDENGRTLRVCIKCYKKVKRKVRLLK